jgi:polyhydroxyalkanoic acid synthase PhaR subunit
VAEQRSPVPDPFAAWREWVTQSERQWNAFFNEIMGTEQYSRSMGRLMALSLDQQKRMSETMGRYLGALNLPTRSDVSSLGDRLASIEKRLASIEERMERLVGGGPPRDLAPSVPRPPRTKKPSAVAAPPSPSESTGGTRP